MSADDLQHLLANPHAALLPHQHQGEEAPPPQAPAAPAQPAGPANGGDEADGANAPASTQNRLPAPPWPFPQLLDTMYVWAHHCCVPDDPNAAYHHAEETLRELVRAMDQALAEDNTKNVTYIRGRARRVLFTCQSDSPGKDFHHVRSVNARQYACTCFSFRCCNGWRHVARDFLLWPLTAALRL